MKHLLALLLSLALAGACSPLSAAESPEPPAKKDELAPAKDAPREKSASTDDKKEERKVVTQHTVTIGGQPVEYTATAGTIFLRDEEQKPTASIFYIAYTRNRVKELGARPVMFSFNGGPGASSVWMHLGLLGPQRVLLKEDGAALPPPYRLVDNEFSLLDETDLVFIDPVSTGFSRASEPKNAGRFHGLREDAASVAEFIRLWLTRNQRWPSPKFVIGESYGTTRAAALSGELSRRHKLNLNGIVLVSTVLNFATIDQGPANDLASLLYLPSYAAAAWYHKKLPAELQSQPLTNVVALAESFAATTYNAALYQGASLAEAPRQAVVKEYARLSGLTELFVDKADLRVSQGRFAAELLAPERRVVGRYDARYTGLMRDRLAGYPQQDPSFEAVAGAFAATFNSYVRNDLKFESDLPYEVLTSVGPWNWGESNGYVNVAETLADAMTRNPFLKVQVSCGYFDLATPFAGAIYTFNHLGTDPVLRSNVQMDFYTAGHMMYLNLADLKKQKADLARFLRWACGR